MTIHNDVHIRPHDARTFSRTNPHGCGPSDPQAGSCNIERMTDEQTYAETYEPGANVTAFAMPASYEDMEYLGLDPITGEAVV